MSKIHITSDFDEALANRYKKYFRFNNSCYWTQYYQKKLNASDFSREKLYAELILKKIGSGGRVLDIGSGYGFLAKELANKNIETHCADLFEEMILLAKNYLKDSPVSIRKADILSLPYKKLSFDCVSLMSIIEHFPHEEVDEDIIPYVRQFIKDSGYLFVHVPVRSTYSQLIRLLRKYFVKDLPDWAIDDDGDVTHKMWLSYQEYIKLLESHNFKLVNFDFHLKRSIEKPQFLTNLMLKTDKILGETDKCFDKCFDEENTLLKLKKIIKSNVAVTSYFLFRKIT